MREELRAELLEARQKTAAMESKHSTDMIDVGSRLKKEGPSPASPSTHLPLDRPTTPVLVADFLRAVSACSRHGAFEAAEGSLRDA